MRIGKGIHPDGVPGWCQGFSLDGGSGVRAVKVIQHGNRPGLIYNIGKSSSSHLHDGCVTQSQDRVIKTVNPFSHITAPNTHSTQQVNYLQQRCQRPALERQGTGWSV